MNIISVQISDSKSKPVYNAQNYNRAPKCGHPEIGMVYHLAWETNFAITALFLCAPAVVREVPGSTLKFEY